MPDFKEIIVETYIKEIESKKFGLSLTIFCVFFSLGLFFWPLILVAFIAPFFVVSKPSIEKYRIFIKLLKYFNNYWIFKI